MARKGDHYLAWVKASGGNPHEILMARCGCGDLFRLVPVTFENDQKNEPVNIYDIESPRLRGYLRERFKQMDAEEANG